MQQELVHMYNALIDENEHWQQIHFTSEILFILKENL